MINSIIDSLIRKVSAFNQSSTLQDDLENYVSKLHYRLNHTKNLIFRSEPVDFYENYIPLTLTNDRVSMRISDPVDLLNRFDKIGVVGNAGSGKTTLLRHVALKCIDEKFAIPIFIDLRNLSENTPTFEDFVANQITATEQQYIKKLFESGQFLFVLDGYDEIDYQKGASLISQIEDFIIKYSDSKFIISSRPGTNIESLQSLYIFRINPLNEDDIYLFINKINIPTHLKNEIFRNVEKDIYLREILNIPLLLALYIVTFQSNFPDATTKKSIFLRRIIDSLFAHHDSITKLGYVRQKISNLTKEQLEMVATTLAFRILFSSKHHMSKDELFKDLTIIKKAESLNFENDKVLYDLTITVSLIIESGNYYLFAHILIMEYLAATFISGLRDNIKKDIYKKISERKAILLSLTMIELLYDLDMEAFIQFYLIPQIENNWRAYRPSSDFENTQENVIEDFISSVLMNENSPYFISPDRYSILAKLKEKINSDENMDPLFDILN